MAEETSEELEPVEEPVFGIEDWRVFVGPQRCRVQRRIGDSDRWRTVVGCAAIPKLIVATEDVRFLVMDIQYNNGAVAEVQVPAGGTRGEIAKRIREHKIMLSEAEFGALADFAVSVARDATDLPVESRTSRLGWDATNTFVVMPNSAHVAGPPRYEPPVGSDPLLGLYRQTAVPELVWLNRDRWAEMRSEAQASFTAWRELLSEALDHIPALAVAIGHSAGSLLLSQLPSRYIPTFLHLGRKSSAGKTTIVRIVASGWGNPEEMLLSWAATDFQREQVWSQLRHLPCFLDEIRTETKADLGTIIFALAGGAGRGRAGFTPALKGVHRWRLNCLSSGERHLHTEAQEAGSRVRVLTLSQAMPDMRTAERLEATALQHHGALAAILAEVVPHHFRGELSAGEKRVERVREWFLSNVASTDAVLTRKRQSWAVSAVGLLTLAEALMGTEDDLELRVLRMYADIIREDDELMSTGGIAEAERLLLRIHEDWTRHPRWYVKIRREAGDPAIPNNPAGFYRPKPTQKYPPALYVYPDHLRSLAQSANIPDLQATLAALRESGDLIHEEGKLLSRVTVADFDSQPQVYGFPLKSLERVAAEQAGVA